MLLAALVVWLEIDSAKVLIMVIDELALKTSTTYPFSCIIFHLCRDAENIIWHFGHSVD